MLTSTALRTDETAKPASALQRRLALDLGSVPLDELTQGNAGLKLDRILAHARAPLVDTQDSVRPPVAQHVSPPAEESS